MKKRTMAAILLAAAALSVTGCKGNGNDAGISEKTEENQRADKKEEASAKLEQVTVILDYVANTNHTGLYVAKDKGYYEEAGLDVSIVEPTEGATATLVSVGKGDFGISYQEDVTVALASKDPLPIKAVAAVIQHNTSGFAVYEESDIHSPADFEGKTYAGWGGPGEEAVLKAVMAKEGADFSKLSMVISDGSGFAALKDKADIMWFYEGWDNIKCKMKGFPIRYMELRQLDDRLDYYTPVIIAGSRVLDEKPDMVRKFLKATEAGYRYAVENPDESAEILQKYAPDYSIEMLQMSQEYLAGKYMEDSETWGTMKDSVWDSYTDFLKEYGVIDRKIPAYECYTNEFLPQ
ncbi:ABC transporter substrate-binding protein [Clostridium sp. AM58-1XD]|uniref:ABC transporter substrate-binding protein n=1 Tax=Clostridium sp. AM58-1XD TaxID=2292307 RepID=UPI000E4EC9E3|nr:ABC transporter substrate-binding protein [Clostridium sp. AM58-1XD]RGY96917.1 ABC transporter substrate-binding protein [Clostridium sp. AM58-1XD]